MRVVGNKYAFFRSPTREASTGSNDVRQQQVHAHAQETSGAVGMYFVPSHQRWWMLCRVRAVRPTGRTRVDVRRHCRAPDILGLDSPTKLHLSTLYDLAVLAATSTDVHSSSAVPTNHCAVTASMSQHPRTVVVTGGGQGQDRTGCGQDRRSNCSESIHSTIKATHYSQRESLIQPS